MFWEQPGLSPSFCSGMTAPQIKTPQALSLYLQEITADKEAPAPHDESVNKEDCRTTGRFNLHTDYKPSTAQIYFII